MLETIFPGCFGMFVPIHEMVAPLIQLNFAYLCLVRVDTYVIA